MTENKNNMCGDFICLFDGEEGERCSYAEMAEHQAFHGGLTDEAWKLFVKRMKDEVLPHCKDPESLKKALEKREIKEN